MSQNKFLDLYSNSNDTLFLNRPDWVVKDQLRRVSLIRRLIFLFVQFYYKRIALNAIERQKIMNEKLNIKNVLSMEQKFLVHQSKINLQINNYIKITKKILRIG